MRTFLKILLINPHVRWVNHICSNNSSPKQIIYKQWFLYICVNVYRRVNIHIYIWVQVKIGGPEQAPGPHPFHTPVPYPRSIPPWRIRSIPPFQTSVPYLWSIRYNIYIYIFIILYYYVCRYIWYNYVCIYIHRVLCIFNFVYTYAVDI